MIAVIKKCHGDQLSANMSKILLSLFVSVVCLCNFVKTENDGLLSVVVLFRHGERTPIRVYKNDPYGDITFWPIGYGQLTDAGKLQQYNLGQWFRQKYADFLPDDCVPEQIKIISSDTRRTILSVASHLTGLFALPENQTWDPLLVSEESAPCQINVIPSKEDPVLGQHRPCPKYDRLYKELLDSENFKKFFNESKDFFGYLSQNSGDNITTFLDIAFIFSTLYVEKSNNLTLPEWAEVVYPIVETVANFSWAVSSYTRDLARLNAGPLLDNITTYFEDTLTNQTSTPKYLILSAHDYTIVSLLDSLGVYDYLWPEYASSVILELREKENRDPFINILYKNSTFIKNITIQGCTFDCGFEQFQKIVKPIRIDLENWEMECADGPLKKT